jgi:hypothetical protein
MFTIKGKEGIYMISGKPIKNGKWIRVGKLFNESTVVHSMVQVDRCKSIVEFRLPKLGKDDPALGIPSESYELQELIDNLHTWKKGKEFKGTGFGPAFKKNVCPLSPGDMVYNSKFKKLVEYYNYFTSHINNAIK